MVLPIDLSPDELQGLITHELTHVFEFDLIPRSMVQRSVPLWVDEGLADYMRGSWDPIDLMSIRDAAVTEQIPPLSRFEDYGGVAEPAPRLQPRPRRLRVHRGPLRQGGHPAVPLHLPQEPRGRRDGRHLPAGLPDEAGGVRRGVREVAEGALQALPRQAAPERLRQGPLARTRKRRPSPRSSPLPPAPPGRSSPPSPATGPTARRDIVLLSARDGSVIKNLTKGFTGDVRGPGHQRGLRGRPLHRLLAHRRHRGLLRAAGQEAQPVPRLRAHRRHRPPHRPGRGPGPGALPASRREGSAPGRAQGRRVGHLPRRPGHGGAQEPDRGRVLRHRPPDLAGRDHRHLYAPDQRPRQGVRLPPGQPRAEDPAHLRRLRRQRAGLLHGRGRRSSTPRPRTTTSTTCAAST